MAIIRIGVDLAKNVFAVHGVDEAGRTKLTRTVRRDQLLEMLAAVPPCLVAMEACSGAHHWARQLVGLGHTPRILAPKFVAPYRMSGKQGKNDANDAAAICEAAGRPNMRFVPMKTAEQQALLSVHRVRQGFVEERTATVNRLRGLLSEFGVVLPLKAVTVRRQAAGSDVGERSLVDTLADETVAVETRQWLGVQREGRRAAGAAAGRSVYEIGHNVSLRRQTSEVNGESLCVRWTDELCVAAPSQRGGR
jgi:transposase